MKMSNHLRAQIKRAAIYRSPEIPHLAKLVKTYADFAEEMRQEALTHADTSDKDLTTALAAFEAATPAGFRLKHGHLCEPKGIFCVLNGLRITLLFNGLNAVREKGNIHHVSEELEMLPRCPALKETATHIHRYIPVDVHISKIPGATERFLLMEAQRDKLLSELSTKAETLTASLKNVTSVKQLLEVWPEAKELLPKESAQTNSQPKLPAIPAQTLNKMFSLPT